MDKIILNAVITEMADRREKQLQCRAVFDLDSTLFDVSPRLQKIIHDFANLKEISSSYPEAARLLRLARTMPSDWGIRDALARAGLEHAHPEAVNLAKEFWRKSFFSNEYVWFDKPIDGAIEFVQLLHRMGVEIAYLTGRDEVRMGTGTREVLAHHGFPIESEGAQVVLKKTSEGDDEAFKSHWFRQAKVATPDARFWFFENEPLNINLVEQEHPDVSIIFIKSTHAKKAKEPGHLPVVSHFRYF